MAIIANTFSIVARCSRSGMLGVAVSSAVPAVGALCPFIRSGVGAVSTQSWVNPYLALTILDSIAAGATAQDALQDAIAADSGRDQRQLGVVDHSGNAASWTGGACTSWCGHIRVPQAAIQGNMLTGSGTLEAMAEAYTKNEGLEFDERLMRTMEAGQTGGGDKRGNQSAALTIFDHEDYALLDLRVDEHAEPIAELRRVLPIAQLQLLPFVRGMPGKTQSRNLPQSVKDMLLKPPPNRPGGGGSPPSQRTEDPRSAH